MLLRVYLWCYDQKTQVTIEASHPVGWSRRAIKLRHQIQFYKQIRNKAEGKEGIFSPKGLRHPATVFSALRAYGIFLFK